MANSKVMKRCPHLLLIVAHKKINTAVLSKTFMYFNKNFFSRWAAVIGEFYWYEISLLKTVRNNICLKGIYAASLKKNPESLEFYGIV